jgi:hypothetical protein
MQKEEVELECLIREMKEAKLSARRKKPNFLQSLLPRRLQLTRPRRMNEWFAADKRTFLDQLPAMESKRGKHLHDSKARSKELEDLHTQIRKH